MSQEPPRPILKLKLATQNLTSIQGASTPTSKGATTPKITLKFSTKPSGAPPSVAESSSIPKSTKKVKKPRPQLSTTQKRDYDTANGANGASSQPLATPLTSSGIKRLKLISTKKTPTTPFIKIKAKGKPPTRPLGVGYDSEASDCEEDPAIEEEFILRMQPGDDCEYLRKAIEEKSWGAKSQGGADIKLKFLRSDGRRAVLIIRGRVYAATLVDLPCIVEGMKSWDRRGFWKTADICQMLLVLGVVPTEGDALEYPIPKADVNKDTWAYSHGLTPPMRWVRKRRFRHRVDVRTIEAAEAEVERLFRLDAESLSTVKYELTDLDALNREINDPEEESDYGDQDAEGEPEGDDYFGNAADDRDDLEADLERAIMGDDDDSREMRHNAAFDAATTEATSHDSPSVEQGHTDSESGTPAAVKEDSGDDDSGSDDDGEDVDEDLLEQQADLMRQREEIADLKAAIDGQHAEYERVKNDILKKKILGKINSLKADLALKQAAIGEGEDD